MNEKINITIPLLPPTVNHYWKHTVRAGQHRTYVSAAGKAFKRAVATLAAGTTVIPDGATTHALTKVRYRLTVKVVLGKGQSGDGDNFWKAIADGLAEAGVIHSDARVRDWFLTVDDTERGEPRCEITAERL